MFINLCVCVFFPFRFEGGRRDLIVLDPADCCFMLPSKGQIDHVQISKCIHCPGNQE